MEIILRIAQFFNIEIKIMNIDNILNKALNLSPISFSEALHIYKYADINVLADTAHRIRCKIKNNSDIVTWQIDRNINITNVCVSGCKFCSFHCKMHQTDKHFITTKEQYRQKISELIDLGGDQVLLQGGLHPKLDVEYYENLFAELKEMFPSIKLHALGPPEIVHISKLSGCSYEDTLTRLMVAGLDSLPGAGAEILDTSFRKRISPGKCSAEQWLDVMSVAHKLGLSTSATMVYGLDETLEMRIEHLFKIRELQNNRPYGGVGFVAFIPWFFSIKGTILEKEGFVTNFSVVDYIRIIAMSRILLTNIDNIQASWLTVGREVAQIALHSGANDLGSIMIEENVVSSTGLRNKMDSNEMQKTIINSGFIPLLRDQSYNLR